MCNKENNSPPLCWDHAEITETKYFILIFYFVVIMSVVMQTVSKKLINAIINCKDSKQGDYTDLTDLLAACVVVFLFHCKKSNIVYKAQTEVYRTVYKYKKDTNNNIACNYVRMERSKGLQFSQSFCHWIQKLNV